jgi:hypothetical protein
MLKDASKPPPTPKIRRDKRAMEEFWRRQFWRYIWWWD